MSFGSNKNTFEARDVVLIFSKMKHLQKPEKVILERFKEKFKEMKMLDLGVGAGRTTSYFAPLTKEYVGIDYAKNMIKSCQKRFPNFSFLVCDVRDMKIFKDNYFDFIFFSYNGLDCIDHEGRVKALKEIKRVCKEGGFFFFSSHNLQSIDSLFNFQPSLNPWKLFRAIARYFLLRILNEDLKKIKEKEFTGIMDGAYDRIFSAVYYIKPKAQIRQLESFGFKNVHIFSVADGEEITGGELEKNKESWLYYLCNT